MPAAISHAQALAAVRCHAADAFRQFRLTDGGEPRESILLDGGMYCGRRFDLANGYAIWTAQSDELTVCQADGKQLTAIPNASAALPTLRAAA